MISSSPFLCLVSELVILFSSLMLPLLLRFHNGADFVLPSFLAFLSPNCLDTKTVSNNKVVYFSNIRCLKKP